MRLLGMLRRLFKMILGKKEFSPREPEPLTPAETPLPVDFGSLQGVDYTPPPSAEAQRLFLGIKPEPNPDWDMLSPVSKQLFEDITPYDPSKVIRYPAPTEGSTQEWVAERLKELGVDWRAHQAHRAFRRVRIGHSMNYLDTLKRRAELRDTTLTPDELIALRERGIS